MALDERSRRRLEELGRRLPQPLPRPDAPSADAAAAKPEQRLHPLETETDPAALFGELIRASADGSVPPHHLQRLRQLEQASRNPAPVPAPTPSRPGPSAPAPAQEDPLYVAFAQMLLEDEQL